MTFEELKQMETELAIRIKSFFLVVVELLDGQGELSEVERQQLREVVEQERENLKEVEAYEHNKERIDLCAKLTLDQFDELDEIYPSILGKELYDKFMDMEPTDERFREIRKVLSEYVSDLFVNL